MNKAKLKQLHKNRDFISYEYQGRNKHYRLNYSIHTMITKTKNIYQRRNKRSPSLRQLDIFFQEMEKFKKQRIVYIVIREMVTDYLIKKIKIKNRKLK